MGNQSSAVNMTFPPTPPIDIKLSETALRVVTELSQRAPNEVALLKSLWSSIKANLDHEPSILLHVTATRYDPMPATRRDLLEDTGALLVMPAPLAQLVLHQVEENIHKLSRDNVSDEQWAEVQTLAKKLAVQHPDHVTNVIRLWQKVIGIVEDGVWEGTIKDLGLLWQLREAEAVVVLWMLQRQKL